jgi:CrcB protein
VNPWLTFACVLVAGGVGAVARYSLQRALPEKGTGIPRAVLIVNMFGSLLAGATAGAMVDGKLDTAFGVIVITGLCGGLTTFSTFAVETMELFRVDAWKSGYLNILITFVGGVGLATVGFVLTRAVL